MAVKLDIGEEISGVKVEDNVLEGWEVIREGYPEKLVNLVGEVKRYERRTRNIWLTEREESRPRCSHKR